MEPPPPLLGGGGEEGWKTINELNNFVQVLSCIYVHVGTLMAQHRWTTIQQHDVRVSNFMVSFDCN